MESHIQANYNMVSQLALRVALQTMKERCLSLQQRLSVVEEENDTLRGRLESDQHYSYDRPLYQHSKSTSHNSIELDNLRSQVAELNRQKVQLSDHINMVANENRKLWSRLSEIAKEQQEKSPNDGKDEQSSEQHSSSDEVNSPKANPNLIRSRTFTHHSPNPNLKMKVINFETTNKENDDDPSLEEVLLAEESSSDDDEDINRELKTDDMSGLCETELGFTYLNVHDDPEDDFNIEAKKCLEGLHKIRLEIMQQHLDMTCVLDTLENRFVLQGCSVCTKKPEMLDKSLNTDDVIPEIHPQCQYLHHNHTLDHEDEDNTRAQPVEYDLTQRKLEADKKIKVCPMCGAIFGTTVTFDQFCSHVENHFYPDSSDSTSEQNYEIIAQPVGDF